MEGWAYWEFGGNGLGDGNYNVVWVKWQV